MNQKLNIALIVLGIGIITSLIVWQCNKKKTPIPPVVIVHDTVMKRYFVYDTTKGAVIQIPERVTYYDTTWIHDTTLQVEMYHDTILLKTHDSAYASYNTAFLEAYPTSPKLILGEFSPTKISLSLMGSNGTIIGKDYTTDYSKYNYEFSGTELKFYPIKQESGLSKLGKNFSFPVFMSTTYNPVTNGATLRLDGSIMYGKIGATIFSSFSTDQIPHANAGIGLKVQLH